MGVPAQGSVQEEYSHHLRYDGVLTSAAQGLNWNWKENLFGHASGVGNSTPWSTPPTRPIRGGYADAGTATGTTATTLTDTTQAWTVNQWVNRIVISQGTGQALTQMTVTSNTATVLTGASWSNGTPGNTAYLVTLPPTAGAQNSADLDGFGRGKLADNWQFELRALFNPGSA